MDFIREDNTVSGVIKALNGDTEAGRLNYNWSGPDRIIIDHTEVYTQFREQGLGSRLVEVAVDFARENGIKIIPLCPFARKVMESTPESRDIIFTPPPR
ncbi:GNAT family N-acetyltransferase [Ravibacter arvi]|uniref:GNAT family N-acetyltransferase n=1 Tax=Ravibacter arvi TaxID=2051041 RepID=A0ABP8LX97_9BACT